MENKVFERKVDEERKEEKKKKEKREGGAGGSPCCFSFPRSVVLAVIPERASVQVWGN
jgi:hypothetical protein